MTILSPRLALNLNYLLSCRIAFCRAARATPCRTLVVPPSLSLCCASLMLVGCCITSSLVAPPSLLRRLVVELPPLSPHRCLSLSRFALLPRRHRCRPTQFAATGLPPPLSWQRPQFEPTDPPPPPGHIRVVDVDIIDNDIIHPPHMITVRCIIV